MTEKPRVLVVDDSDAFRRLVRASLEPEGFLVDEAASADRGLDLARKTRYQTILVDFVLPDADGLVLLEQFGRWGVDAPVIALSGSESPEVAMQFLRSGVVEYLRKDLASPARVAFCVRQALRVGEARARLVANAAAAQRRREGAALPASKAPRARGSPDEILLAAGATGEHGEGRRVLVVDDTEDSRYLVRRTLERQGWVVEEAGTGREALEHVRAHEPDVILLDYLLPDTQGVTLLRTLRDAGSKAPVIALTGHGSESIAQEFVMAGATDFLGKDDLTEARLLLTLRNALLTRQT